MVETSNSVANQAVQMMGGNQPAVQGQWPAFAVTGAGGNAGISLNRLYGPTVATVARSFGWDFARRTVALVVTGNVAPVPWLYEYAYPTNGIQAWQILPAVLTDPNDPLPINWGEGNVVVGAAVQRVLFANINPALVVYNNNPNEDTWDALFRQSVVELLGRALALSLAGKPDLADSLLNSYGDFVQVGISRQD